MSNYREKIEAYKADMRAAAERAGYRPFEFRVSPPSLRELAAQELVETEGWAIGRITSRDWTLRPKRTD